jgi:archaetidylinositol phosphate synthase
MPNLTFRNATRILRSPLAAAEKRCLIWLAQRTPGWINSDHLTALALGALIAAGAAFAGASSNVWSVLLVLPCLALNWLGDSLDGTLARVRGHERPRYGFYVDHVLDAVGTLALVGGLALSGFMSPVVALGVLVAYYLVSIEVYLATYTLGTFRITYAGVGPTELRILLAMGVVRVFYHPTATIAGHTWLLFDVGGVIAIGGLLVVTIMAVATHIRTLYRAEPLVRSRRGEGKGLV